MHAGGILRIAGIAMTPRIILMTDGQPTDSAGEEEVVLLIIDCSNLNVCELCVPTFNLGKEESSCCCPWIWSWMARVWVATSSSHSMCGMWSL